MHSGVKKKQNETKQQKVASRKSKRFPTDISSNSTYRSLLKASNLGSSKLVLGCFLELFKEHSGTTEKLYVCVI